MNAKIESLLNTKRNASDTKIAEFSLFGVRVLNKYWSACPQRQMKLSQTCVLIVCERTCTHGRMVDGVGIGFRVRLQCGQLLWEEISKLQLKRKTRHCLSDISERISVFIFRFIHYQVLITMWALCCSCWYILSWTQVNNDAIHGFKRYSYWFRLILHSIFHSSRSPRLLYDLDCMSKLILLAVSSSLSVRFSFTFFIQCWKKKNIFPFEWFFIRCMRRENW